MKKGINITLYGTFTLKGTTITLVLAVLYILATNLAYLPGPDDPGGVANRLHDLMLMLTVISVVSIPIGLIWMVVVYIRNIKMSWIPILLTFVPLVTVLSIGTLNPVFLNLSRNRSIEEATVLIAAVESFHDSNGHYPENLAQLVPSQLKEIPKPSSIGSREFYYKLAGQFYELEFRQNIMFDFDVEHVTYNPPGSPEVIGFCYETGHENWKYCIPD